MTARPGMKYVCQVTMENKVEKPRVYSVGVAEKNPLVQAGLKQLLGEDERFNLIVVCADGERFLEAVRRFDLDVGIIGWIMPNGDGKYVLDHLVGDERAPRIIVYTGDAGEAVAAQVMAHGGAGYVSKSDPPERLLDTVAAVAEGKMVFPYLDVRRIHDNPLTSLTRRELEVLAALAAGRSNKQIAIEQQVSLNTVKFHVKNLYSKLEVRNRAQAVALYLKS